MSPQPEQFLIELSALLKRYDAKIESCGCCGGANFYMKTTKNKHLRTESTDLIDAETELEFQ